MTQQPSAITRVAAVLRTVPDLRAAERFYSAALDFTPDGAVDEAPPEDLAVLGWREGRLRRWTMRLGSQSIQFLSFDPPGRSYPAASTATDLWFQHCAIVVGDMAQAHRRVLEAGAQPITEGGPQHLPANTGGVTAFKFRDPFGHPLELLALPKGVGDPVWHSPDPALFCGIDHTAVAISSTAESRRFYESVLGLEAAEQTHNRGPEQTRLDAVPDDSVTVTALKPSEAPPHLELLGYGTGTRRPLGVHSPADVALSRTLAIGDLHALENRLVAYGVERVALRLGSWGGRAAIAFDDPDGHGWICQAVDEIASA